MGKTGGRERVETRTEDEGGGHRGSVDVVGEGGVLEDGYNFGSAYDSAVKFGQSRSIKREREAEVLD